MLVAFFMTGTGNSYTVARWCAQVAETTGLRSQLIQIKAGEKSDSVPLRSLAVFTYPTHGFTAPWLIMKYVWCLPNGHKNHAIVLPNRAGIRIKGVFFPGLEGTAGYLIALLLWFRGYRVQGVMGVDMPSNWTALHWGLSGENAAVITNMAKSKVKSMLQTVLAGNRHYDGIVQLFLGAALAKISLMYIIMAQFILAKLFFASDKCNGCSLCQSICPKKALRMVGRPGRPYWTYSCDSCMACMNYCPQKAIEVSPFIITLFYYIAAVPVAAYAMRYATNGYASHWGTLSWFGFGIQYGYTLVAIALAYVFLHFTLSSRLIREIAGKLSHTRYFRRYKAEGVSLKDIHLK
ncbi:EFR1 family ferrodoxin [Sporomusa sp. KB1]|jgi:ferredoxin|uniref:EFR1 family ferrodoxin n=1 Tax=Sporomusa sp. KB1 TaxID=943346 RepID=UPI002107ED5E|nr:EFR1 family ferrodoxin [Sporomusa sp. KB1]